MSNEIELFSNFGAWGNVPTTTHSLAEITAEISRTETALGEESNTPITEQLTSYKELLTEMKTAKEKVLGEMAFKDDEWIKSASVEDLKAEHERVSGITDPSDGQWTNIKNPELEEYTDKVFNASYNKEVEENKILYEFKERSELLGLSEYELEKEYNRINTEAGGAGGLEGGGGQIAGLNAYLNTVSELVREKREALERLALKSFDEVKALSTEEATQEKQRVDSEFNASDSPEAIYTPELTKYVAWLNDVILGISPTDDLPSFEKDNKFLSDERLNELSQSELETEIERATALYNNRPNSWTPPDHRVMSYLEKLRGVKSNRFPNTGEDTTSSSDSERAEEEPPRESDQTEDQSGHTDDQTESGSPQAEPPSEPPAGGHTGESSPSPSVDTEVPSVPGTPPAEPTPPSTGGVGTTNEQPDGIGIPERLSLIAQSIEEILRKYANDMGIGKRPSIIEQIGHQRNLSLALNRVVHVEDPTDFDQCFEVTVRVIYENRNGAFKDEYVYRALDNITIDLMSDAELELFRTLIHIFTSLANPVTRSDVFGNYNYDRLSKMLRPDVMARLVSRIENTIS